MKVIQEWRDIPGWEGYYQVADDGRIRSVDRVTKRPQGDLPIKGRAIRPAKNKAGHLWFNVCREGRRKKMYVHRAVATAFIGPVPDGMEVRHLDGDPENNRVDNLTYGTRSENMWDRVHHGRHPNAAKTRCVNGHAFDADNTYHRRNGRGRECRKCRRISARRRKEAA